MRSDRLIATVGTLDHDGFSLACTADLDVPEAARRLERHPGLPRDRRPVAHRALQLGVLPDRDGEDRLLTVRRRQTVEVPLRRKQRESSCERLRKTSWETEQAACRWCSPVVRGTRS